MKEIFKLFFPSISSFKSVLNEAENTSISRERFIDFIKTSGLLMLIINSFIFLFVTNSGGEYIISNLSTTSQTFMTISWFTIGMSLFIFSMGFSNLIAWYSNVGRDGSQWNYLVDRINALVGPVLVWIIAITTTLNILLNQNMIPDFLTTFEDGVISSVEFSLWPLWMVSIYLVMVMFAPFTIYIHKKYPYLSITTFIALLMLIDFINFPINFAYMKVLNYLFFWLTIHQIGYFFADGKLQLIKNSIFPIIAFFSYGYLYYQLSINKTFLSFSNYRLSEMNNEDPPTAFYFVASIGLLSLLFSFKNIIEKFLNKTYLWKIFSLLHSNIYTLYLWHSMVVLSLYLFGIPIYIGLLYLTIATLIFGNYERSVFRLSSNLLKRVNPLQPWPSPIKARFSMGNFSLAWVAALLVLLGIIHLTLGGIGQNGFFNLREFYFMRSNTFEGMGRIITGILLLNVTVRGLSYKKRILFLSIIFTLLSLYSRIIIEENITYFEYGFNLFLTLFFVSLLFPKRNYQPDYKVK